MSFICQNCQEAQKNGVKPILFTSQRRKVKYPERYENEKLIDKGGSGFETAQEIQLCEKCIKEKENGTNF
jgi:hypothetical protein